MYSHFLSYTSLLSTVSTSATLEKITFSYAGVPSPRLTAVEKLTFSMTSLMLYTYRSEVEELTEAFRPSFAAIFQTSSFVGP